MPKQVCYFCVAASQGYGLESYDGLEDPGGSGDYLNTADLADGFQTSDASAAGLPLDDDESEFGDGMTNEQYGKAQQLKKMSQQKQVQQLAMLCALACICAARLRLRQKMCLGQHESNTDYVACIHHHGAMSSNTQQRHRQQVGTSVSVCRPLTVLEHCGSNTYGW